MRGGGGKVLRGGVFHASRATEFPRCRPCLLGSGRDATQSLEVGPQAVPSRRSPCLPPGAGAGPGPGLHRAPDRGGSEGSPLPPRAPGRPPRGEKPPPLAAPPVANGREPAFWSRGAGAGVGATGPGPRTWLKSGFSGLQSRETPASVPAGGSFREPPTFSSGTQNKRQCCVLLLLLFTTGENIYIRQFIRNIRFCTYSVQVEVCTARGTLTHVVPWLCKGFMLCSDGMTLEAWKNSQC